MEITLNYRDSCWPVMAIIVGLDFFLEAFFIFRPLMVSTFTGLILGDVVPWGLKVGALIELCICRSDSGRWYAAAKPGIRRSDGYGTGLYDRL